LKWIARHDNCRKRKVRLMAEEQEVRSEL